MFELINFNGETLFTIDTGINSCHLYTARLKDQQISESKEY